MCFKAPKPPPVKEDPELARQKLEAKQNAQVERAAAKEARTNDRLLEAMGRSGRSSLFSGGAGGQGFVAATARSLFSKG